MRVNAEELRRRIALKSYTKASFSRALGVSTTAVYKITSGKMQPSPETLIKMCKLLDVEPDEIVEEW